MVRLLTIQDMAEIHRLLAIETGYSLFIANTLFSFGFTEGVSYWGIASDHVRAILMIVGDTAAIYAEPGWEHEMAQLAEPLNRAHISFVMGPERAMQLLEPYCHKTISGFEQHHFAELPKHRYRHIPEQTDCAVRRAVLQDAEALARLYHNTDGYKQNTFMKTTDILSGRIARMRVYIAEDRDGTIVSGAMTSAESPTAAMIGSVYTLPEARGRGFADAVVSALCAELLRASLRPYLFYLIDNTAAEKVYKAIGFRDIGRWRVTFFEP